MQGNEKREYLKWTEEMENALREFYEEYTSSGRRDGLWKYVAEKMSQRFGLAITSGQCQSKWKHYAGPNPLGKKFTPEEDELLTNLVEQYGENNWGLIANNMPTNRNARQCRERWKKYLSKNRDINSGKFTSEEDQLLMQKYKEYGTNWDQIAQFFQGRTPEQLKNRCQYLLRLQKSKQSPLHTPTQQVPAPAFVPAPQNILNLDFNLEPEEVPRLGNEKSNEIELFDMSTSVLDLSQFEPTPTLEPDFDLFSPNSHDSF